MHENSLRTSPVWDMLSAYGKRMVLLADGVLGQTAQARREAYAFNATLGEARENGEGMYLAPGVMAEWEGYYGIKLSQCSCCPFPAFFFFVMIM